MPEGKCKVIEACGFQLPDADAGIYTAMGKSPREIVFHPANNWLFRVDAPCRREAAMGGYRTE